MGAAASQSEDTPAEEFAEPVAQIEDDEIPEWIAELDSEEPVIPSTEPTEDAAVTRFKALKIQMLPWPGLKA